MDGIQARWVINKKFDIVFFLAPSLLGIVYFALLKISPAYAFWTTVFTWIVFAQAHFGSTWFIYFDQNNRAYYGRHPVAYYAAPVLIFVTVLAIGYYNQQLLLVLIAVASLYHVSRQSIGILQLYRAKNKEFYKFERKLEAAAIFSWSLLFTGIGGLRLPEFRFFVEPALPLAYAGLAIILAAALAETALIIWFAFRREQNSTQKNIFLASSMLLYSPYIYATGVAVDQYAMEVVTLTSLIAHYMQYMGLVWLINKNKYSEKTVYGKQNAFLRAVSQNLFFILALIFGYGAVMAFFRWFAPYHTFPLNTVLPNIVLGLVAIHFYIDAFIWRFRNPYIRETVLPFIRPMTNK